MALTRITSGDLKDSNVTTADLANDSVTKDKLGIIGIKGDLITFSTEPIVLGTGLSGVALVTDHAAIGGLSYSTKVYIDNIIGAEGATGLRINAAAESKNYIQFAAQLAGLHPSMSALGESTDISFRFIPKGTGWLRVGASNTEVVDTVRAQSLTNKILQSPALFTPLIYGTIFNTVVSTSPPTLGSEELFISMTGFHTGTLVLPSASASGQVYIISTIPGSGQTGFLTVTGATKPINGASIDVIDRAGDSCIYINNGTTWATVGKSTAIWDKYKRRGAGIYHGIVQGGTANATATVVADRAYALPYVISCTEIVTSIAIRVIAGGAASTTRFALYRDNGNTAPGALLTQSQSVASTASTTTLTHICTGGLVLNPGLYWTVVCVSATAPTLRGYAINNVIPIIGYDSTLSTAHGHGWTTAHAPVNVFPDNFSTTLTGITAVPLPGVFMEFAV